MNHETYEIEEAENFSLTLEVLRGVYFRGVLTPRSLCEKIILRCDAYEKENPAVWISRLSREKLFEYCERLEGQNPHDLPLYGVPFAIKDNIDLEGVPTTAGCSEFSYVPEKSAFVVERLIAAGAIPIGKTNLDQFATGLVGTRSPNGAVKNFYNSDYISGGSSSGSAVAVAAGLCTFSLGTDTAGSGRVPAALNGVVGLKPSRGLLSISGVVPACRSLDCVSIFARKCEDAARVLEVARGFDFREAYSRDFSEKLNAKKWSRKIGVPRRAQLEFLGNSEAERMFAVALEKLAEVTRCDVVEIDFSAFLEAACLLYEGPWTAERYAAVGDFLEMKKGHTALDSTVAEIILRGKTFSAVSAFRAMYRLEELRRNTDEILGEIDYLCVPTIGTCYTIEEVKRETIRLNSNLGFYNNFLNLLDLCGLTLPVGNFFKGPGFGVTLIAERGEEEKLLNVGNAFLGENKSEIVPKGWIRLAVCGAHLRGHPLHFQLQKCGALFLEEARTAKRYRFYALANTNPSKPGLVRVAENECVDEQVFGGENCGDSIALEIYAVSPVGFGEFVAAVPSPLVIGNVELENGKWVKGFLCEPCALVGAQDITSFGGWAKFLQFCAVSTSGKNAGNFLPEFKKMRA